MALPQSERLTRDKWADAALLLMAREGVAAVTIERLASILEVTKGSAYHHFHSRAELVELALARWEEQATSSIIEQLQSIADPATRLRAILTTSVGRDPDLGVEYLIISASDPVVAPFVERVTVARVQFLEQIYRDFGLDAHRAAIWGRSSYAAYLGVQLLRHASPADRIMTRLDPAYIDELMLQLTPSGPESR